MTKKERGLPRLPHSEAVNRRRILAEARQPVVFDINKVVFDINKKILETRQAQERLEYIGGLLSLDNTSLSHLSGQELEQTRTSLEIERIWLQFRLGVITKPDKKKLLTSKFDELEQTNPDLYSWLVTKDEHGQSMAEKIRDNVIPPIRDSGYYVSGYYTKR